LQVTYVGVLNIIYDNNTEDYDTVVRNMDMSHRLSQMIESHYRNMTNHHQCLDDIRLLFQLNAT